MMGSIFTEQETAALEATYERHRRAGATVPLLTLATLISLTLLAGIVLTEYTLFFEVFSYLKGPAVPGEAGQWSIELLALSGTVMMLGFHLLAEHRPNAFAVWLVDRCAALILPLYAVGAGLAVSAVIYFDGADALVSGEGLNLFSADDTNGNPLFDRIIGKAPMAFAVACGGLAVVNLFIAHRLLASIITNIKTIFARTRAAFEACAAIKVIRACELRSAAIHRERAGLLALDQRMQEELTAQEIVGVISQALQPYETLLIDQQMRGGSGTRFEVALTNLDPKQLAKRVAALRAINVRSITSALRSGAKEKA